MQHQVGILPPKFYPEILMAIFRVMIVLLFVVVANDALAASEDSIWASEVEVGASYTTGNTEETNFKFRGEAVRSGELYDTTYKLDLQNRSQDDERTAERVYGVFQLDRNLSEDASIFGRIAYDDDRFSGYDYQVDLTGGYSRDFINSEIHKLTGDIGIGYRQSELETSESEDELIFSLSADYQ